MISSSFVNQDVQKWMGILAERVRTKDPRWRLNSFLVDDPSFNVSIIRFVISMFLKLPVHIFFSLSGYGMKCK